MRKVNGLAIAISVLAFVAAGYAVYEPYTVRQDAAAVQTQAKSLADQVGEACAKGGPAAAELVRRGACAKAAEVKDQPNVATTQTATQPDPSAVRQAARTAVADYCAAPNQPCRGSDGSTPPFDAIVDAVVAKIPAPKNGTDGQNGADATTAQVVDVVVAYCGQPEEPCRGRPGTNGESPPCLTEPGQCRGADGQPGPACPDGYELRDAVITAPDGTTYSGKACVDPGSSAPPSTDPPLPLGGN